MVVVFYSVHAPVPGQDPKRTNLSSGKPEAHQSIRMSLAGTNLPNELPLRVHHSHMRSRCAVARTSVNLLGSWPRFTSNFWRCSLPRNRKVGLGVLTPPPDLLDDHGRSRRGEDTASYPPRAVHGPYACPLVGSGGRPRTCPRIQSVQGLRKQIRERFESVGKSCGWVWVHGFKGR